MKPTGRKKPGELRDEGDVKALVQDWFNDHDGWHYAPVQSGLGVHGIHDRLGCVPIVVTPEMVGKRIGLFVSVESKKPGRRGEKHRGMSQHQFDHMNAINEAGGISICCDGKEDLAGLDLLLYILRSTKRPPGTFP